MPKEMAVGKTSAGMGQELKEAKIYLDQFTDDTKFLESIRTELHHQYPNCWIAIYKREVVSTAPTLKEVMRKLTERNIPKSRAVIDFLREKPIAMIL